MNRHWHPNPEQTRLLHAALDRGSSAAAAWEEWKRGGGDIQTLDNLSARLFPLIAKNLTDNGIPEPELGLLRGVRRYAWVEHAERIRRLAPSLAALAAEGIELLFLKGVALAPLYYGELGLRMLADVDVLVRHDEVPRAITILGKRGVRPLESWYPRSLDSSLAGKANLADQGFRHGLPFLISDGLDLDLHWSVMTTNVGPHSDDAMWSRAVPFTVVGVRGLTLSASDHLLHVIVHGLSFNTAPTIRWITDAMTILRSEKAGQSVDWKVFVEEVRRRKLVLPLREALDYLISEFDAPVPPWVRASLAGMYPTLMARLRYEELLQPWDQVPSPGRLFAGVARFVEGRPPLDALRVSTRYFWHRVDRRGPGHVARQVALSLTGLLPGPMREALHKRGWLTSRT